MNVMSKIWLDSLKTNAFFFFSLNQRGLDVSRGIFVLRFTKLLMAFYSLLRPRRVKRKKWGWVNHSLFMLKYQQFFKKRKKWNFLNLQIMTSFVAWNVSMHRRNEENGPWAPILRAKWGPIRSKIGGKGPKWGLLGVLSSMKIPLESPSFISKGAEFFWVPQFYSSIAPMYVSMCRFKYLLVSARLWVQPHVTL